MCRKPFTSSWSDCAARVRDRLRQRRLHGRPVAAPQSRRNRLRGDAPREPGGQGREPGGGGPAPGRRGEDDRLYRRRSRWSSHCREPGDGGDRCERAHHGTGCRHGHRAHHGRRAGAKPDRRGARGQSPAHRRDGRAVRPQHRLGRRGRLPARDAAARGAVGARRGAAPGRDHGPESRAGAAARPGAPHARGLPVAEPARGGTADRARRRYARGCGHGRHAPTRLGRLARAGDPPRQRRGGARLHEAWSAGLAAPARGGGGLPALARRPLPVTPERRSFFVRAAPPLLVGGLIVLLPVPEGLKPQAWYYFALFAAVIVGVATEPIPPGAVGLAGVVIAAMSGLVFKNPTQAVNWALSGFGQPTVWLIFGAYVLSVGYEKTGLGKRIALRLIRRFGSSSLGLGYAITLADLAIAPFTPSNTARSAGTIYPVIRNIPSLYGSEPGPTARKIGGYLMYSALGATCVTSSMFPTALAPNILAVLLIAETVGVTIPWIDWVTGYLPVGVLLLLGLPPFLHRIYPPEITRVPSAPKWAAEELGRLGPMRRMEWLMLAGTLLVISLWIAGNRYTDATTAALLGVVLLVVRGVVSWDDILGNRRAWDTVMWI